MTALFFSTNKELQSTAYEYAIYDNTNAKQCDLKHILILTKQNLVASSNQKGMIAHWNFTVFHSVQPSVKVSKGDESYAMFTIPALKLGVRVLVENAMFPTHFEWAPMLSGCSD